MPFFITKIVNKILKYKIDMQYINILSFKMFYRLNIVFIVIFHNKIDIIEQVLGSNKSF